MKIVVTAPNGDNPMTDETQKKNKKLKTHYNYCNLNKN